MEGFKKVLLGFGLALIFMVPLNVRAFDNIYNNHDGCTYSDFNALKNAVALVKFSYEYDKTNYMTITASGLQSGFYAVDELDGAYRYNTSSATPSVATQAGYYDGQIVKVNFYASEASVCAGEKIATTMVNLPKYNQYYGHEACVGVNADDYPLCSKWYDASKMSEAAFVYRVNQYKLSLQEKIDDKPTVTEEEETWLTFFLDYYVYILGGILSLSVIGIAVLMIRDKKRRVV